MAEETTDKTWKEVLDAVFQDDYKDLYNEAKRVLRKKQDAEDVLQDVYIKLMESDFEPEIRTNPKAYLRRVVHNASVDLHRSRKPRKKDKSLDDLEVAAPGSERADDNIRHRLEGAFASMSEEVKDIFELHCEDGYSDSEIAEMRGESRSRVASILSRSRARLKENLNET